MRRLLAEKPWILVVIALAASLLAGIAMLILAVTHPPVPLR